MELIEEVFLVLLSKKNIGKLFQNSGGQISIFFSTTVIVMITFIAFIVNIGIFVKAKINLQNATDAAAYAGASVQARQLTNIAYLNWEMRNVYKEWMFKYYVLGGLNLEGVAGTDPLKNGSSTDFTMSPYERTSVAAVDLYDFPSICIDFATNTGGVGLCTKYLVPGLPRFEASNVLGMDATTNALVDAIVSGKSKDCSIRSKINFLTANTWAYNVLTNDPLLTNNLTDLAPEVGTNFMGAFPKAFELALRIRNLEAQVNQAPLGNICIDPGNGVNCNRSMNELTTPSTERALKAYMSAWRNIGKNANVQMKDTFTLTEVSPFLDTSVNVENSLSTLLIPPGSPAMNKYYLDLKIMPINYATFYTGFATTQGDIEILGRAAVNTEGQCNATKIGLPIPGYPLGFVKNPDYLTYYAVVGSSKFTGLFNPFAQENFIIRAYAAAKPFGGRIGPMLFDVAQGDLVRPRRKQKSSPFISALDTGSFRGTFGNSPPGASIYAPGMPIPTNGSTDSEKFWLTDASNAVGGWISGPDIFFGVPNLIYDYPGSSLTNRTQYHAGASENIQKIARKDVSPSLTAGLYNRDMFVKFKNNLNNLGGVITAQNINDAIISVRGPTLYDANNYLIPTPEELNAELGTDSWGKITGGPQPRKITNKNDSYSVYQMNLYAPVFSRIDSNSIFKTSGDLLRVLEDYLKGQEQAINKYKAAMNIVASEIFKGNISSATSQNTGEAAAKALSDLEDFEYAAISSNASEAFSPGITPTCKSIAGKFIHFYLGDSFGISAGGSSADPECPSTLSELLKSRWSKAELLSDVYSSEYALPDRLKEELFSAYRPGVDHDAGLSDGIQINALSKKPDKMIRNYYSTKLIPLKSISSTQGAYGNNSAMIMYSEGTTNSISEEAKRSKFKNPIEVNQLDFDINEANH